MARKTDVIIIGGGAAGFFAAINLAESRKDLSVTILEKANKVLQKVRISGGGRCNVTHACFDPKDLVTYYPRGHRELLGPFHRFMTGDTFEWFSKRGIELKVEEDLRVFPLSDNSQTIIDCLVSGAETSGVNVLLNQNVSRIEKSKDKFEIETNTETYLADQLLVTTGGNPKMWDLLRALGHHIIDPVPSLFTFNITDELLRDLPGISVPNATVSVQNGRYESSGPLLITHWGISGPAVLTVSSFAAVALAAVHHKFSVTVNWLSSTFPETLEVLKRQKHISSKKNIILKAPFPEIPKRLWEKMLIAAEIESDLNWSDVSFKQLERLSNILTSTEMLTHGKTTFKEEFVTAGGVDLKEVNFKRFESKLIPGLFFAGEVLNIDGVTGGFNFQNAWTGGYIAGSSMADI